MMIFATSGDDVGYMLTQDRPANHGEANCKRRGQSAVMWLLPQAVRHQWNFQLPPFLSSPSVFRLPTQEPEGMKINPILHSSIGFRLETSILTEQAIHNIPINIESILTLAITSYSYTTSLSLKSPSQILQVVSF